MRISTTGRVSYTVPGAALSEGGGLSAVTVENGDSAVTTVVKTYVLDAQFGGANSAAPAGHGPPGRFCAQREIQSGI